MASIAMEQIPATVHAFSGAVGSSLANFLMFPLDVVTVRLQVQRDVNAVYKAVADERLSIVQTFRAIIKHEGWPALFRGAFDDMFATALQAFLYFFVYEYFRNKHLRMLAKNGAAPKLLGIHYELMYGSLAGVVCKAFTTPLKNIVVLKQVDPEHKTLWHRIKTICETKGTFGLWSGYKATFLLSINPSIAYYFYQLLGSLSRKSTTLQIFLRAALAKSMATVLTYPVIQAKTRTQAGNAPSRLYSDMRQTFKTNGFGGLYDGISAQLLKGVFTQGITMASKESISTTVLFVYLRLLKKFKVKKQVIYVA